MFQFDSLSDISEGERNFYVALLSVSILAAVVASAITLRLTGHVAGTPVFDLFTIWTMVAGAVGGMCGFLSTYSRWLGYTGSGGIWRAVVGSLMISGIAAVVSGTLILPYYGTMFAPFQLIIAMIESPMLGVVWVGILIAVHKLMEPWRRERDSIFAGSIPIR